MPRRGLLFQFFLPLKVFIDVYLPNMGQFCCSYSARKWIFWAFSWASFERILNKFFRIIFNSLNPFWGLIIFSGVKRFGDENIRGYWILFEDTKIPFDIGMLIHPICISNHPFLRITQWLFQWIYPPKYLNPYYCT
jgi:hypothetical protein